jgi:hypothetical protein
MSIRFLTSIFDIFDIYFFSSFEIDDDDLLSIGEYDFLKVLIISVDCFFKGKFLLKLD